MIWFRWYSGTAEDTKFRVAARYAGVTVRDVIALWAVLLEDAAHDDHRGICTRSYEYILTVLGFDEAEDNAVERMLEQMHTLEMIEKHPDHIVICNWDKRQFAGDKKDGTVAERMRKYRERKKKSADNTAEKRDSYGSVTALLRPEQSRTEQSITEQKDIAADAAPSVYAFVGKSGIIRLKSKQLEDWQKVFPNINVVGCLTQLDTWFGSDAKDDQKSRWFFIAEGHLRKKDQEARAKAEALAAKLRVGEGMR